MNVGHDGFAGHDGEADMPINPANAAQNMGDVGHERPKAPKEHDDDKRAIGKLPQEQTTAPQPGEVCPRFAPLLEAFYDEALSAEEMQAVSAHVAGCAWCQTQLQTFAQVGILLRSLPEPQPSDLLRQRLQARIAQERTHQQTAVSEAVSEAAKHPQQTSAKVRRGLLQRQRKTILVPQPTIPAIPTIVAASSQDASGPTVWPTLPGVGPLQRREHGRWSWLGAVASVAAVVLLSAVLFALTPRGGHFKSIAQVISHQPLATVTSTPGTFAANQTPSADTSTPCAPASVTVNLPANTWLTDLAMVSASLGWAIGATRDQQGHVLSSLLLNYSNCRWQVVGAAWPGVVLNSISMISSADGWIAGGAADGTQKVLLHYQGGEWLDAPFVANDTENGELNMIRMQVGGNGWLIETHAATQPGMRGYSLYQAQQSVWSAVASPLTSVSDIAPISTNEAWFAGQVSGSGPTAVLAHEVNGRWTTVPVPDNGVVTALRMLAPNDGWAMGQIPGANGQTTTATALLLHYDGTAWTRVDAGAAPAAQQVMIFEDGEGWAVGVHQSASQSQNMNAVVSFLEYESNGQWQTIPWRFPNIINLHLVRIAAMVYWGLGYYTSAQGVTQSVLLYFTQDSWYEYGS